MEKSELEDALHSCADDISRLEPLYNEYYRAVVSVTHSILKNRDLSFDAAQDTFARLLSAGRKYRKGEDPKAFILGIAANVAKDYRRKYFDKRNTDLDEEISDKGSGEENACEKAFISSLLNRLTERQRLIVVFHVYQGLTLEQTAKALNIHRNTALSDFAKAKEALRIMYTKGQ